MKTTLNVVLYQPEIPQNTGNIMRTCVGTNVILHLIKPLGFSIDDKSLKRAGVNYIEHLKYFVYEDYEDFKSKNEGEYYYLTRYGNKPLSDTNFKEVYGNKNIYLIFGRESTGIPYDILRENFDNCFRLPTNDLIRSLNLSNCVCVSVFEVLRQLDYPDLEKMEPNTLKGNHFIA
jgi:tRNA (cytidine/uridine-2'-O-)-methyltransferase